MATIAYCDWWGRKYDARSLIPFNGIVFRLNNFFFHVHVASNGKLILKNYPRIFFERLRKIMKNLSHERQPLERESIPGHPQ
jgi:hypothetical protein